MSQTQPHRVHNLRTRAESAAERSEPATVDMSLMNIELCNNICDKFAEALRVELNSSLANVVNSFKEDIVDELRKRDHEILALKSDNINLRENLNSACDKITILEANIIDISSAIKILNGSSTSCPPPAPPKEHPKEHSLDTVVAGDSVVKHLKPQDFPGENNKLVCLPGARAEKVVQAVKELAVTSDIKQLVVHFGTNSIFHKSKQSPAGVAKEVISSLEQIKSVLPASKLFFSAILPKIDMSFTRGIEFINWKIWQFCKRNEIGFIEHPSFCCHGDLNERLFAPTEWWDWRPIHPSHEGVRVLKNNIKPHLL